MPVAPSRKPPPPPAPPTKRKKQPKQTERRAMTVEEVADEITAVASGYEALYYRLRVLAARLRTDGIVALQPGNAVHYLPDDIPF